MTTNVQKNNVSVNKFRHIIITTSLGTLKVKSENISPFLDSCSAWRTRRINTKNQSATSQKRGRLKCTPGSAAAATFGPVGTSGTFGTLGTDGTSHSLSMSFLIIQALCQLVEHTLNWDTMSFSYTTTHDTVMKGNGNTSSL